METSVDATSAQPRRRLNFIDNLPATNPNTQGEDPEHSEPPDGGTLAYLQVLAGVFVNALTWGYASSFGQFQAYYVFHYQQSVTAISWIGTIQLSLIFFIGTFSGRAADARLARPLVFAGSVLIVFGIFMASIATEYWQILLLQGLCVGLGGGLMYMPMLAVIGTYFRRRKGLATGIAASGTGVGGIVFPATVQYLEPQIGFAWALRAMGLISLVFTIVINLCLRPRLSARRSGALVDCSAFKEVPYVLFSVGVFLVFLGLWVVFQYINLFATTNAGFSTNEAANLLLILNAVGIPSRIFLNWASDRWLGSINAMILTAACQGIVLFCWTAVDSRSGLYVFAVFCGVFANATLGVFASALASITENLAKLGTRMGMIFTFISFASLTGGPIVGALIERDAGRYTGAQVWLGGVTVLGCLIMGAARVAKTGWVLMARC